MRLESPSRLCQASCSRRLSRRHGGFKAMILSEDHQGYCCRLFGHRNTLASQWCSTSQRRTLKNDTLRETSGNAGWENRLKRLR